MDGKIEKHGCIKFCVKLGKSATENLEMIREAFGEGSLSRTAVLYGINVSRSVECQFKMTNVQGDKAPAKRQKLSKKVRELIRENRRRKIHLFTDTSGISYGVCQEIFTENLNMRRNALSSRQRTRPHVPENHRVCD
jgi:hypothetical protein